MLPGKFTHDTAYVAYLIIKSMTLESLQKTIYIVSRVDITIKKLSSYVARWSSTVITRNPTLLVHSGDWMSHAVQL